MASYRDLGIETYGDRCEICNYGVVEVHHLSYQEYYQYIVKIRNAMKKKEKIGDLVLEAEKHGFKWDGKSLQKDDRSTNLSVLCPNCHSLVHTADMGLKVLRLLPKRR